MYGMQCPVLVKPHWNRYVSARNTSRLTAISNPLINFALNRFSSVYWQHMHLLQLIPTSENALRQREGNMSVLTTSARLSSVIITQHRYLQQRYELLCGINRCQHLKPGGGIEIHCPKKLWQWLFAHGHRPEIAIVTAKLVRTKQW